MVHSNSHGSLCLPEQVSCVHLGGNLASVHSKGEYDFLKHLVRTTTGGDPETWVGGYDAAKVGDILRNPPQEYCPPGE